MKMPIVRCSWASLVLSVAALGWGGAATRVAAQCATFPSGYVPFTQVYATYPTSPGSLIVGAMSAAGYSGLSSVPLPAFPGETFCAPIQLAPGYWVFAYVPTAAERFGDFSHYLQVSPYTQLYDPISGTPYLNNLINPSSGIFAWHIAGPAPGPSAAAQAMISQVNALYAQGALNSGQDNSLVKQLQNAANMISAGKINGAIGNLQSFIVEVQDLENSGVLTTAEATTLIYEADIVIAELSEL